MPKSSVATVTTTAAIVVPQSIFHQTVWLHSSSGTIYIGDSDLTVANGYRLDNGDKISINVGDYQALYAITSSGTATLYVLSQIN
jgi:protein involved in polysaccharide export with SLBB domain